MTTTNKLNIGIVLGIMLATIILLFAFIQGKAPSAIGSIVDGQGYSATTTAAAFGTGQLIRTGQGMVGSVVVTLGSGAPLALYNATTTNINLRTGNTATSTITIATFPTTATAGTYTFDVNFTTGLLIDTTSTVGVASTTVTYK